MSTKTKKPRPISKEQRACVDALLVAREAGWTLREIAAELSTDEHTVAPSTLNRWERGESVPFHFPAKRYLPILRGLVE